MLNATNETRIWYLSCEILKIFNIFSVSDYVVFLLLQSFFLVLISNFKAFNFIFYCAFS